MLGYWILLLVVVTLCVAAAHLLCLFIFAALAGVTLDSHFGFDPFSPNSMFFTLRHFTLRNIHFNAFGEGSCKSASVSFSYWPRFVVHVSAEEIEVKRKSSAAAQEPASPFVKTLNSYLLAFMWALLPRLNLEVNGFVQTFQDITLTVRYEALCLDKGVLTGSSRTFDSTGKYGTTRVVISTCHGSGALLAENGHCLVKKGEVVVVASKVWFDYGMSRYTLEPRAGTPISGGQVLLRVVFPQNGPQAGSAIFCWAPQLQFTGQADDMIRCSVVPVPAVEKRYSNATEITLIRVSELVLDVCHVNNSPSWYQVVQIVDASLAVNFVTSRLEVFCKQCFISCNLRTASVLVSTLGYPLSLLDSSANVQSSECAVINKKMPFYSETGRLKVTWGNILLAECDRSRFTYGSDGVSLEYENRRVLHIPSNSIIVPPASRLVQLPAGSKLKDLFRESSLQPLSETHHAMSTPCRKLLGKQVSMYVHLLVEWVLRPDVKPVVSMSILNHIVSLSQVLPRFFSCLGKATSKWLAQSLGSLDLPRGLQPLIEFQVSLITLPEFVPKQVLHYRRPNDLLPADMKTLESMVSCMEECGIFRCCLDALYFILHTAMSPQQCRAPPPGATQQLRALFIECCTGNLMAQEVRRLTKRFKQDWVRRVFQPMPLQGQTVGSTAGYSALWLLIQCLCYAVARTGGASQEFVNLFDVRPEFRTSELWDPATNKPRVLAAV